MRCVGRMRDGREAIPRSLWALQPCAETLPLPFPRYRIVKRLCSLPIPQFPHLSADCDASWHFVMISEIIRIKWSLADGECLSEATQYEVWHLLFEEPRKTNRHTELVCSHGAAGSECLHGSIWAHSHRSRAVEDGVIRCEAGWQPAARESASCAGKNIQGFRDPTLGPVWLTVLF